MNEVELEEDGRAVLASWMLAVSVTMPPVSRSFEALGLPTDRQKAVKIRFRNTFAVRQTYCFETDAALDLARVSTPRLSLGAGEEGMCLLTFGARPHGTVRAQLTRTYLSLHA